MSAGFARVEKTVHWSMLSVSDLSEMPILSVGQDSDLKFDDGEHRVWLSRMTPSDWSGQPGYERVSYEVLRDGRWVSCDCHGRVK